MFGGALWRFTGHLARLCWAQRHFTGGRARYILLITDMRKSFIRHAAAVFFGSLAPALLCGAASARAFPAIDFDMGASKAGLFTAVREAPFPEPALSAVRAEEVAIAIPVLPPGTKEEYVKSFNKGFVNAVRRLRAPKCSALFGSGAERRFVEVSYRFVPMGAPAVGDDGGVKVVGAATIEKKAVFINNQGPFMSPVMLVPGKSGFQIVDMGTGLRGADFSGLLLLHELGHVMGLFGPDADDSALNRSNTQRVLDSCFY